MPKRRMVRCKRLRLPLALALVLIGAGPLSGQLVRGTIRDGFDRPLPSATAELLARNGSVLLRAMAALDGSFTLVAPGPGSYHLRAWRIGADTLSVGPVHLEEGSVFELDFLLEVLPVEIEGIDVTVEARIQRLAQTGFYDRARISNGLFFTPEVIAERRPVRTTDLLIGAPGVHLDESMDRFRRTPMITRGWASIRPGGATCLPAMWVNGLPMHLGVEPFNLDDILPAHILGIEVYRSPAETPAQYSGHGAVCGVIVVWTR